MEAGRQSADLPSPERSPGFAQAGAQAKADPFLRWRRALAENARTAAAIAETCDRIAEGQATLARALEQLRDAAADPGYAKGFAEARGRPPS